MAALAARGTAGGAARRGASARRQERRVRVRGIPVSGPTIQGPGGQDDAVPIAAELMKAMEAKVCGASEASGPAERCLHAALTDSPPSGRPAQICATRCSLGWT